MTKCYLPTGQHGFFTSTSSSRNGSATKTFLCSLVFLLTSFHWCRAQTTPVDGTTTFNTISNGAYLEYAQTTNGSTGFLATNVENSGWDISGYTSGPDDYVIAGENWGTGSDGGLVYLASVNGFATINSMRFRSNDGQLFDLGRLDLGYDVNGSNTSFTITGYRNDVPVSGAVFSVPLFSSFGNGGGWSRNINVAANSNFKGIDEFRITPVSGGVLTALDVDNLTASNFRTAAYTQIVPADLPAGGEGPFTKTIEGQVFTFTPSVNNWVGYQNDIGSEGFGGLYAYDYDTPDGTEYTLSAPAGYSFDIRSFQYISDRGPVNLSVTLTYTDNSTDTKSYTLNGNSAVQTFAGFSPLANDVKSIRLVSDQLVYYNNLEMADVKAASTLPLSWLSFTAARRDIDIVLQWRTAAEEGTKDFVVQHSTDGRQWQNIGTVTAAGNSLREQAYSFVHRQPASTVNFYRLLQRDTDGRERYSKIIRIDLQEAGTVLSVYPNPVTNGAITLQLQGPAAVRIYNSLGVQVLQKSLPGGVSSLYLGPLPKGLYTLKSNDKSLQLVVN